MVMVLQKALNEERENFFAATGPTSARAAPTGRESGRAMERLYHQQGSLAELFDAVKASPSSAARRRTSASRRRRARTARRRLAMTRLLIRLPALLRASPPRRAPPMRERRSRSRWRRSPGLMRDSERLAARADEGGSSRAPTQEKVVEELTQAAAGRAGPAADARRPAQQTRAATRSGSSSRRSSGRPSSQRSSRRCSNGQKDRAPSAPCSELQDLLQAISRATRTARRPARFR